MAAYKDLVGQKITKVTSNPGEPKTGQMWYNSTSGTLRGLGIIEAFSSASPLSTGRFNSGAGGTTSATWIAGGFEPSASDKTEEFNGTGFSSGGSLNTARGGNIGTGVQTAGLTMGGGPGSSPYTSAATEEYNGSSWTTISPGLNTERLYAGAGGTQTAGVVFAGSTTPNATVRSAATEEYNGSSWTTVSGGNVNSAQSHLGGCGTQTAALKAGGDDPGGSSNNSEEYNGSTWTTGNNLNTARRADGTSGIQTQALVVGGFAPPGAKSVVESYDGTSFTETADLATAQYYNTTSGNTNGTGVLSMGGTNPSVVTTVEEYNKSTNVITAGAWASAATMGSALYGRGGCGTTTAGLLCGGHPNPGQTTETFDGTSFSEVNDLGTGRRIFACFGTQTAAVAAGGNTNPGRISTVEEWDGSSWSANPNSLPATIMGNRGTGTQTAGLIFGGTPGPPSTVTAETLEFDGTSFSDSNDLNTARSALGGAGIQTASLAYGGNIGPSTVSSATESYNGTSWTNSPTPLIAARQQQGAAGTSTAAASFGGSNPIPSVHANYYVYNGTSWITQPSMANARSYIAGFGTTTSVLGGGGYGVPAPTRNQTEEFTGETTAANVKTFSTS